MSEIEVLEAQGERVGLQSAGLMRAWATDSMLPSGETRRGLTARLAIFPPERFEIVGTGSMLEIDAVAYDVITVEPTRVRPRSRT